MSITEEWEEVTNIQVLWLEKKRSHGMQTIVTGKKLPRKIKIMLVNSLLDDLKINVEIRDK